MVYFTKLKSKLLTPRNFFLASFTMMLFHCHNILAQTYNMGNSTVTDCAGTFFDSQGNGAQYLNNENLTETFCPSISGQCVRLTFTQFNIENGFDFLTIYNGPNTASPVIGTYTGTTSPGTVTATTGCLTIRFTSDFIFTFAGWRATLSCVPCPTTVCGQTCTGGPAPANDACSGAQNLGALPIPVACPSGIASPVSFNTTNLCATAEVPYTTLLGCQPAGNMASPAADVWYQFTIIAPTLNVNITGLNQPNVGIYGGTNCNNLTPLGCAIGGGGSLSTTFGGLAAGTYYMQVSGGNLNDQCNFTLQLQNNYDCAGCVIQSGLTVNPPPVNGTYQAGQTVNFCYTITDYNQTSVNWLHAVTPTFGPGWSMPTLSVVMPANCSGAGNWVWVNGTVVSSATGLVTGPGWFYESPLGCVICNGANPGDNYGDNNPSNTCDWTFCWTITTVPPNQCVQGMSLNINLDTYGDGESGSWTSFACNLDPITHFFATLACCTPPQIVSTPILCNGGLSSSTATGQGTGPWTYVWKNGVGTTLQTANAQAGSNTINNLAAGTYTVTVTDNTGCTSQQTVTITAPAIVTGTIASTNVNCNGGINGTATVTPAGGTGPYTYTWAPAGGTGATASGLGAGTYTVTIRDANGCTGTASVTITQPVVLSATMGVPTNVSCNGGTNGSVTVTAAGGTGPYTYSWAPSGGIAATASNLAAGTYTVTITDSRGCTRTATATITQPPVVTATMGVQTNVSCNGGNNGSATVTAGGGTGPYTYSWAPSGGAGATGTNLSAGTYTVTVTDSRGCIATTNVTITQPTIITYTTASTPSNCGSSNGTASVTPSGGTGPYTYAWVPSGGTGSSATGLAAGGYSVTITDARGCIEVAAVAVSNNTGPTASIAASANVSCNGGTNGTATVSAVGGTAPYTYSWSPSGGTGVTASGLSAGGYTATVTDANGCVSSINVTITEPTPVTASTVPTNVNCNGGTTGTATVTPGGGTGPYTYSWAPSGGTGATANNLAAGTYTVTVTDSRGCTGTATATITQPTPVTASTVRTNVNCNGATTGTATVTAGGGNGPYTYSWAPSGGTAATASNLAAGTYTATVTDANGCTATATATITQPTPVTASTVPVNVNCNGGTTGSVIATPGGGTGPYTYSWAPSGGTGATANNLAAGTYTVTITDANGCTATAMATITQPTLLTASTIPTDALCNGGATGSVAATPAGGNGPYTYSWLPSGGTGATANNLAAGTYTVTVTDANGCTANSTTTVSEPTLLTAIASSTDALCNGGATGSATANLGGGTGPYTYSWAPSGGTGAVEGNLSAGTYTVTITDANGCTATASTTITEPTPVTASTSQTNVNCNGGTTGSATATSGGGTGPYTYSWAPSGGTGVTESNLAAGTYTVTVTDANGCTATANATITEPTPVTASTAQTNVNCNGGATGTATVTPAGGTGPYTYSWAPSGGTGATANNLSAGTYTVTVTDANGCNATATATIIEPTPVTAAIAPPVNVNCNGGATGNATVAPAGGTAPYTYSWAPSGGAGATASNLAAGTYTVTVTDANGCTTTASTTITEPTVITSTSAATPSNCGAADGTASVTPAGGVGPYTYSWAPSGGAASSATGLAAGAYTVTVTDANGCVLLVPVVVSNNVGPAAAITSSTNILCNGAATGSATASANGGTAPYTYSWSPSGGTGVTANNLAAGNYTFTVTDANGCVATSNVIITEPTLLTSAISASTNILCNGGTDGTATVTANGGTVGYTYSWAPSGGTGATASNLSAGNYTVTVTDANGCTAISNVVITEPTLLTSAISASANVLCNGGADGSATVTANGGTVAYTYAWAPSGGTGATATNLSAGNYTVTITDANGCTSTSNVIITEPTILTSAISASTNILCNGGTDGSATVTANGGTVAYTYSWAPSGGTGATATNLAAGNYTVTITDANGCTTSSNVVITEPTLLTSAISASTNILCNGGTDGSATVTANGGTVGYTYSWAPSGGTGTTASNLVAGNYTVTVTDANGCTSVSNVVITEPTLLTSAISASANVLCNGGTDGSATVTANGGTVAYTYLWAPSGGTGATENNLTAGNYTVTITDANGCTTTSNVIITEPTILTASTTNVSAICGQANGSATVTAGGGTAGYTYLWSPSGGTGTTENNLVAGSYDVTVTDANGCTVIANAVVANAGGPTATASNNANVLCNGGTNGSASVAVVSGTAPYTYSWSPVGGAGATANNLPAGNYTITVTDANGCVSADNVTITEPTLLTSAISASTNILCNGGTDGSATVTANGGTVGYTYSWAPSGGTGTTATNLAAGNYTVTVTDANGCTSPSNVTITEPTLLTSAISASANVLCNGGTDGSATVTANGGTVGYTYLWAPSGGTGATENNLAAGNYSVTITDANGCTSTSNVIITEPTILTSAISASTNVLCNGGNNGSATVTANGGTVAYTYLWAPSGGTGATENNLVAGNYTVTITDANGCTTTSNVVITEPTLLTSAISASTNILCNGGTDGSATVTANGGIVGYTYLWAPSGGTGATANNLAAGNYSVTITDANGCTTSSNVVITEPTLLTSAISSSTNILCNGGTDGSATVSANGGTVAYTYLWAPSGGTGVTANNLSAGNYSVTITDANGCTTTSNIIITEPTLLTASTTTVSAICNQANGSATVTAGGGTGAYTYLWSPSGGTGATENNLVAGSYDVTVTDANGCTTTVNAIVANAGGPTATASNNANVLCNGGTNGSASVAVVSGTAPFTYAWSPIGGAGTTASNLPAGNYTITVTDANGCISADNVTITEPTLLTSAISASTNILCNGGTDGSATVTANGGTIGYTYLWAPSGGTGATATNLTAGNYTVTITDANGCTTSSNIIITEPTLLTSAISTSTNILCNGGNNGSATVTANGGTLGYTYLWTPLGGTGSTENNLVAGNYSVTITDANGCTSTSNVIITEPTLLTSAISASTNILCNGGNNGSATVTANGGTVAYTYAWIPSGGTGATENNLTAGNYTVNITDANGCTTSSNVIITEPTLLTSAISASTNILCNGGTNGSATVTSNGGTVAYTYAWLPSGGTGATANNLPAGNYTVTITDANGCTTSSNIIITEPALLTSAITASTNMVCNGGTDGSATVTANGGTFAYTYAWVPSGGTGATENNLTAGNYTVNITDANGCTTSSNVIITEPTLLTASTTTTISSCAAANGSATVTALGGTGAYTYLWSPSGGTGSTENNIAAGSYDVTVTDANGCTITVNAIVTNANGPTATASLTNNVSCNLGTDGAASVAVVSGTAPFTYAWSPAGGTAATATNLPAGNYTITVTDANGCISIDNVTITEPTLLTSAISASTNVLCNGGTNGSATVTANGGTTGYTYLWAPSGGTGATENNLVAGNYSVTVTDANGCTASSNIIITEPTLLTSAISASTNILCNGGNNGSASVTANGGTVAYAYLWAPSGGTGATENNLVAGNYTVTITDANGCTSSSNVIITEPTILTSAISASTNVSCNGGSNGTATVTANGGTAGYTYSWSSGGTGATENNLAAGNYTVTITDANGCTTTSNVIITEPTILASAISASTNVLCNGGNNGSATVTANGGTTAYTYLWAPSGGTGATENNLVAGNYTVTITDANGCTTSSNVIITEPTLLTSAISASTNILCNGGTNGSATVTANGGTVGYTYLWAPSGGTGATANNLSAGNYTVTTTDANGCTTASNIIITEPSLLTSAISASTNELCFGGTNGSATVTPNGGTPACTYLWSSGGTGAIENNLAAGNYTVTITDANGCTTSSNVIITEPAIVTASTTTIQATCNTSNGSATVNAGGGTGPYTYLWSSGGTGATENGLAAAVYNVTVTDANGCTATTTANVTNANGPTATASNNANVLCNGGTNGSASVSVVSGTAPFTYAWSPAGGTGTTATNLPAGNYTITVTDANGCISIDNVTITEPTLLTSAISASTNILCNGGTNGSATVTANGGTTAYTYAWVPSGGTGASAINLAAANYTVTVTDANGCTSISNVNITEPTLLTSNISASTNVSCNGGTNGSATVTANGGTTAYSYLWSPTGGTSSTENNLIAGNYSVTITDANGCTSISNVIITQPTVLTASATTTQSACAAATGTATVVPVGGTIPYTYLWSSGGTAATENNLAAGAYSVTVTDANGCSVTTNTAVANANGPSATSNLTNNITCNGANDGTASVAVVGGTAPYTYAWSPAGGIASSATNLPAGNYTITVTDANGCVDVDFVTITEPAVLTSNITVSTNVSCHGGTNGAATVVAAGGTIPYSYLWTPSGATTPTALNLAAANYSVTITDAHGCTTSSNVIITEPTLLWSNVSSSTNVLCNAGNNGTATVTVNGGVPAYSYLWAPSGGTTATAINLSAGVYNVTVTDVNNCVTISNAIITEPTLLTASTTTTSAACGQLNGSATVTANGGTGAYTYAWAPAGGTGSTANGLAAGNYTVTITDANGCNIIRNAVVGTIAGPTATANATANVLCNGGNDGSASVAVAGGTAPFTYAWSPIGGTGTTATNLTAGIYTITVTDALGCVVTDNLSITEPTAITLSTSTTQTACGVSNGTATVTAGGGTGAYTYLWAPAGGTSATATSLPAGLYDITVTDANGCSTTVQAIVSNIGGPTATASVNTNVTCNGGTNGSASVVVSSGTAPFTYIWTPGGGTGTSISNMGAGSYSVMVTDAIGCISAANIIITEPLAITLSTTTTTSSCTFANGSATVTAVGGTGAFSYLWSSGGTGATENNLSAGTYTVTVTDANGCAENTSATVTNLNGPIATASVVDNELCFGGTNGAATVSVVNGTAPFTYAWSPAGGTGATATNLPAGAYAITVTDANGCVSIDNTTISEPALLTSSINTSTNVLCNGGTDGSATVTVAGGTTGYQYLWSPSGGTGATETNLIAGNYTVNIIDANGCTSSSNIIITEPALLTSAISTWGDVLCSGGNDGWATASVNGGTATYNYLWTPGGGTFATGTNLIAGNYSVTITDANGCVATSTATVSEPTPVLLSASSTPALCFGSLDGSATVVAGGGTSPYTYSWSPAGGTGATALNISAGTYSVVVTDGNGCVSNISTSVTEPPIISFTVSGDATICDGQNTTISVNASGGTSPYNYQWSNGSLASLQLVQPGTTTVYSVNVTDANGCSVTPQTVTVSVNPPLNVQATATPSICQGDNATISASANGGNGGPYTYSWNNGAITGNGATVSPANDTTFTVIVNDGCSTPAQYAVSIIVNPLPIVDFTPYIINGCTPVTVDFTNNGTTPVGSTYSWNLGDGAASSDMNPSHTYVTPGHYNVTLNIMTPQGCSGSLTVTNDVNVFGLPVAAFNMSSDEVTILSSTVNFVDISTDAVYWEWDFGDSTGTVLEENPSHTFSDTGYFNVRLIVTNLAGCVDTIYGILHVKDEFGIYIPNAFTPNTDGVNDGFIAYGFGWKDYDMWIFDRWGLKIYYTSSKDHPWDGTYDGNGNLCQNDVYIYKIKVRDTNDKMHEFIGHVTLVR